MASFVHRCPNLGTIVWKFRKLSIAMFHDAWPDEPDSESFNFEQKEEIHWCPRMPPARSFPASLFPTFP